MPCTMEQLLTKWMIDSKNNNDMENENNRCAAIVNNNAVLKLGPNLNFHNTELLPTKWLQPTHWECNKECYQYVVFTLLRTAHQSTVITFQLSNEYAIVVRVQSKWHGYCNQGIYHTKITEWHAVTTSGSNKKQK
jgi:hypothetical protein